MIRSKFVAVGLILVLGPFPAVVTAQESLMVSNGDHKLAFTVYPGQAPVIVLDAGGGHDSTYWAGFAPDLAERTGSKVITYDRASMGPATK